MSDLKRYMLTIAYDGTDFSGWQIQPNSKTVEEELENAFSKVLQTPVDLFGQGRTDAGVHALGQTAHVDLSTDCDVHNLIYRVNKLVGEQIKIKAINEVPENFHARFDALHRSYSYTLLKVENPLKHRYSLMLPKNIDLELLRTCANRLKGEHDFGGFSKFNEDNYTTLCTVFESEFIENELEIVYKISANRFLRNMVRRIVGTMLEVGLGKMSVEDFEEILSNPSTEKNTFTASAKGLVLKKVFYK